MSVDPISLLEERINALEFKMFGESEPTIDVKTPIVDHMMENHRVVSAALSGRDKLGSIVKRLDQLEAVLDPMYEDSVIDNAAKIEFILSMEQELQEITKLLIRINVLTPSLESEQIKNIPSLTSLMLKLTTAAIENKNEHTLVSEKIDDLITKYTEIANGATAVFTTLEKVVTQMEITAKAPKVID